MKLSSVAFLVSIAAAAIVSAIFSTRASAAPSFRPVDVGLPVISTHGVGEICAPRTQSLSMGVGESRFSVFVSFPEGAGRCSTNATISWCSTGGTGGGGGNFQCSTNQSGAWCSAHKANNKCSSDSSQAGSGCSAANGGSCSSENGGACSSYSGGGHCSVVAGSGGSCTTSSTGTCSYVSGGTCSVLNSGNPYQTSCSG